MATHTCNICGRTMGRNHVNLEMILDDGKWKIINTVCKRYSCTVADRLRKHFKAQKRREATAR